MRHIEEAAEAGDPFAQFELGIAFDYGYDREQNFDAASDWYSKAAVQGHIAAEANLLLQHVLGQASIWPPDLVFARLMRLAVAGDRESENSVGLCFQNGYGTTQDYQQAAEWFLRAAQSGLAIAQFNLGGLYFEGHGFEKSIDIAVEWYTKAAQQRDDLALIQLGSLYQKGIGVEKDLRRALVLYSIAYGLGSTRAANHLGSLFKKGLGVERNDSLAYQFYLECVNSPDTPALPESHSYQGTAYYWLGYMAEHGEGVKQDLRLARDWYSKGAESGQSNCVEALVRIRPKSRPRHSCDTFRQSD